MIQRIQSVYLLVVTILIIICLCSPVGSYIGSDYSVSALTNLCLTMADGTKAVSYTHLTLPTNSRV